MGLAVRVHDRAVAESEGGELAVIVNTFEVEVPHVRLLRVAVKLYVPAVVGLLMLRRPVSALTVIDPVAHTDETLHE